jgi:hypothetical protein
MDRVELIEPTCWLTTAERFPLVGHKEVTGPEGDEEEVKDIVPTVPLPSGPAGELKTVTRESPLG